MNNRAHFNVNANISWRTKGSLLKKPVGSCLAAWGFVTALSRMTAYGWDHWYDLALRACNGGIPLLLYFYWKASAPKDKPS